MDYTQLIIDQGCSTIKNVLHHVFKQAGTVEFEQKLLSGHATTNLGHGSVCVSRPDVTLEIWSSWSTMQP